ncbi:MAG: tRNA-intron lyase [Desulfurococcaceae archaeon]
MEKENKSCYGFLLGNRVVVFDYECGNELYWKGYHGTFLGVNKPRSRDIKSPLELSIIEAVYLAEKNLINVIENGKILSWKELLEIGELRVNKFSALYRVYVDLKKRGFVVRRGLKFGCDYMIYRHGPGIDHAPFGVLVYTNSEIIDPVELVRAGRLLHSVRKKLVIAIVKEDGSDVKYLVFNWWKP